MSKLPTVAIIGRPNTGKSTLFNRLIGHRKAIVSDIPGTTRDHIAQRIETDDVDYMLIDTGGMGTGTDDAAFEDDVYEQSMLALKFADVILFLIDGTQEMTADDRKIVDVLRKHKRKHVPVILVISKMDNPRIIDQVVPEYHALGIATDIIPISSVHRHGTEELEARIVEKLMELHFKKAEEVSAADTHVPRIAILGRPNVGKSSLVNTMMADPDRERSPLLVSDIAGTTRDSVDTLIHHEGRPFILIDTAGLKKNSRIVNEIEKFAMFRTVAALESADVSILVLDATQPVSHQDKRIASMAVESGKGMIILVNKIDLLNSDQKKQKAKEIEAHLNFCKFAAVVPVSAKTRVGIVKLFDMVDAIQRNRVRRIPTKELRRWFERVVYGQPLGEVGRSKHITQADEVVPTFVVFVKNPKRVSVSQLRFLDNRLRETFAFEGTPIRWITKSTEKDEK